MIESGANDPWALYATYVHYFGVISGRGKCPKYLKLSIATSLPIDYIQPKPEQSGTRVDPSIRQLWGGSVMKKAFWFASVVGLAVAAWVSVTSASVDTDASMARRHGGSNGSYGSSGSHGSSGSYGSSGSHGGGRRRSRGSHGSHGSHG